MRTELPRETFARIGYDDPTLTRWRRHGNTSELQRVIDRLESSRPPRREREINWAIIGTCILGAGVWTAAFWTLLGWGR